MTSKQRKSRTPRPIADTQVKIVDLVQGRGWVEVFNGRYRLTTRGVTKSGFWEVHGISEDGKQGLVIYLAPKAQEFFPEEAPEPDPPEEC